MFSRSLDCFCLVVEVTLLLQVMIHTEISCLFITSPLDSHQDAILKAK